MKTLTLLGTAILSAACYAGGPPDRGPGGDRPDRPMHDRGGPPNGPRGPRGGDPADRVRDALNIDDAQWQTLRPLVERVTTLRRDLDPGRPPRLGADGGPDGFGPPPPPHEEDRPQTAPATRPAADVRGAVRDLRDALQDEANDAELAAKTKAVTNARAAARAELAEAQLKLRDALDARQTAELTAWGVLD